MTIILPKIDVSMLIQQGIITLACLRTCIKGEKKHQP